ncbi:MAG: gamma-glutamyltransferase [Rhodospirillaceae bacterium]|nr:gamma-glutamyltransferase [Rhodospirillaceae bacterium]
MQFALLLPEPDRGPGGADWVIAADATAAGLGRAALGAGGSAADAAATTALALAVTLPSRAGFGGGGRCLVVEPPGGRAMVIDFPAVAASVNRDARFRAGVPAFARGVFALHARYGRLPWPQVVAPAESLARFGFVVSPTLADDLARHGDALVNDRAALTAMMVGGRRIAGVGDRLRNRALATLIAQLRGRGPGGMYEGGLAREIADAADAAGLPLTADDLRGAVPAWRDAVTIDTGAATVVIDPAIDLAAAADPPADLASGFGTALIATDRDGMVVACALGLNAPFGVGLAAREHGFLFSAAPPPDAAPAVLLAERDAAGRQTFLVGSFGGASPAASARRAHRLADDGTIDAAAFQDADALAISCDIGLADPADGCVVLGGGAEYDTPSSAGSGE